MGKIKAHSASGENGGKHATVRTRKLGKRGCCPVKNCFQVTTIEKWKGIRARGNALEKDCRARSWADTCVVMDVNRVRGGKGGGTRGGVRNTKETGRGTGAS